MRRAESTFSSQKPAGKILWLILAHLVIALPLAYLTNIWVDEASTLYTTERGFLWAFRNALADEKQAPLYFWALAVWRELNGSIVFARLFSIIFSILAIKFFYDLAREIFEEKAAFWATAFFALHPYLIWASSEIRVYSLVIALSVLLLILFHDGYYEKDENSPAPRKPRVLYVVISIVALYTNYYLGFLLVGNFFAFVVARKWRAARNYFLQMLIVGAAFAPLLWWVKSQFAANTSGFQAVKSVAEGLQIVWGFVLTFVLPTEIYAPAETTTISIFRVWLARLAIFAAVVLLVKNRRKLNENIIAFGTIAGVVVAFLLAAYFLLGSGYVEIRHAAVLFAPLVLCAALVTNEIFSSELVAAKKPESGLTIGKIARIFLAMTAAVFFSYSIYTLHPNFTKRGDWARVASFLEQNEAPNQPIVISTPYDALALPFYYRGANPILPGERFFDWELEGAPGTANAWRRQTDYVISKIPSEAREIWLLTNENCDVSDECLPLENFVRAHYTIIKEKKFYKETVRLLRKK